jgi:uncharacterized protein (UPF0264 family)
LSPIPRGVSFFKIGLAGCGPLANWRSCWRDTIAALRGSTADSMPQPVAVVYADWQAAQAPNPDDVLQAASEHHCPVLLIDTWDKSSGGLFEHWRTDDLRTFLDRMRRTPLKVVLAGSLSGESIVLAAQMSPHLIAVRTAACEAGRNGPISGERVRALKQALAAAKLPNRAGQLIGNQ